MTTTSMTTAGTTSRADEVRRHLEVVGVDVDAEHEIYHEDAVLEFPQSGERFEGLATFREWRALYPGKVKLRPTRIVGDGDVWVGFAEISYDAGPWRPAWPCWSTGETSSRARPSTSPSTSRRLRGGSAGGPADPIREGPPSEQHV